jgi:hypothetical protein
MVDVVASSRRAAEQRNELASFHSRFPTKCAVCSALRRLSFLPFAFGSKRLARLAVQTFFIGLLRARF